MVSAESPKKVQHVVFLKFPEVDAAGEAALAAVAEKFGALDGIACALRRFDEPSAEYTHVLMVIADSAEALKAYLHSDLHLKDWMAAVKPFGKGIIVFDCWLEDDVLPFASVSLLRLESATLEGARPHLGAEFLKAVEWPDKAQGYTHCLCKSFADREGLAAYLKSDDHKRLEDAVTCNTELPATFSAAK